MAAAPAVNNAAAQAMANASQRAQLLSTAPRFRKNLGTFQGTNGANTRVKLFNVGIITKLQLYVTAALTIGVATAVASTKAPWNLISRIRVSDYDGTDRINISGFQLFMINNVRGRALFAYHNTPAVSNVFVNPVVPTAVGNSTLSFFLDVPLAFDVENPIIQLQDLRGAILAQTAVGEMYLNIDWVQSLISVAGDVDSLYSGAGTTTVVGNPALNFINMTVWQEYLLPQAVGPQGQIPLPGIDLMTVYELNGNLRSSDNLAVNTEKLLNYPNVRSVIGIYMNYVQGGTQTQGKINQFRVIANGNNVLLDHSELSQLIYQRDYMLSDMDTIPGAYFRSHRDKPIETALYGNVQMGVTPNTVSGGNQYVEVGFESFYTKGQALPGLTQAQ